VEAGTRKGLTHVLLAISTSSTQLARFVGVAKVGGRAHDWQASAPAQLAASGGLVEVDGIFNMKTKTVKWFKLLVAAGVTGAASTGLSALGIATAAGLGVNIPKLDFKQLGVMLLSGGIIGLLAYLKQSPVPPDSGDTNPRAFVKSDLSDGQPLIKPK
jgi:hypothetical protein